MSSGILVGSEVWKFLQDIYK